MNQLIAVWENQDRELRFLTSKIIASYPPKPYLTRIRAILKEKKPTSIGPASLVLGEWKDLDSRKFIESLLLNTNSPDRDELAQALGWIGSNESEPTLWKVLSEKEGMARYGAAWALGFAGSEKSVPILIETSRSKDKRLASLSIESLGQLKSPSSLQALLISSNDDNLAAFAISAISQIPTDEARLELEKMAKSSKNIQSKLAIEAIGQRKDKNSIPVLKELSLSDNPEIRKMAKFALKTIELSQK
jgi:HEAT repeat protein